MGELGAWEGTEEDRRQGQTEDVYDRARNLAEFLAQKEVRHAQK
jgi:hypothetical protein